MTDRYADRLKELSETKDGWNGKGSVAPTEDALDAARKILFGACVTLTHQGGIQLEWHTLGWDVEIELSPGGTMDNVFVAPTNEELVKERLLRKEAEEKRFEDHADHNGGICWHRRLGLLEDACDDCKRVYKRRFPDV